MAKEHSKDIGKWLKLIRADGIGPVIFARLIKQFGTPDAVLGASESALTKIEGIGHKTAISIVRTREKFDAKAELELADKLGICIINIEDARYPPSLKQIYDPPPVLYFKGTLTRLDNLAIAIVGSRRCSLYGQQQASQFAHLLAAAGFTIISGMARGIDTAAHQGALSAQGRTIAVQGCGLANIFPPENNKLFDLISKSGACLSELPLVYEPLSENFPARNRIIAGMSLATIVVEAGYRSGAIITAKCAIEYNREVMAVPGKIDSPLSKGPHSLIKDGAKLIESVEDVMEALGYIGKQLHDHASDAAGQAKAKIETPLFDVSELNLTDYERKVYDCLDGEPLHIDQIIATTDIEPGLINASLISLRLKGLIKQFPGSFYIKK